MMKSYCPPPLHEDDRVKVCHFESQPEEVVTDGVLQTRFVIKEVELSKVHEGLTPNDFSLYLLLANGSSQLLKETKPFNPSALKLAEQVSNVVESHLSN